MAASLLRAGASRLHIVAANPSAIPTVLSSSDRVSVVDERRSDGPFDVEILNDERYEVIAVDAARRAGSALVATLESLEPTRRLLQNSSVHGVCGVGWSPGLSTILVDHAARWLDDPSEVVVASTEGLPDAAPVVAEHGALVRRRRDGDQLVGFPPPLGLVSTRLSGNGEAPLIAHRMPQVRGVVRYARTPRRSHRRRGAAGLAGLSVGWRSAGDPARTIASDSVQVAVVENPTLVRSAIVHVALSRLQRGSVQEMISVADLAPTAELLTELAGWGITPVRHVAV